MSEGTPDPTIDGGEGTPADDTAAGTGPQTVEEVEAFWKHRQSQADKAHAAETAALKAQMDALKAAPVAPAEGESPEAARVRELEGQLQQERTARQAVELRARYPMAATVLGDSIAALPEEKLAAIEAGFDTAAGSGGPPIIDPNSAPRRGAANSPTAKPVNEKTKDELLGDLRRMAPAYQQALREGLID